MKDIGLEKTILGNDAGASLFVFLNEQRKDLSTLAARVAVVEKDNQNLKEENHRLEGAKAIAQAVRSRVLENYKKHHINLNWNDSIIRTGDAAAHRGAARQDWYLYKDAIRHDLALYRRVYSVPWDEACRYLLSRQIYLHSSYQHWPRVWFIGCSRALNILDCYGTCSLEHCNVPDAFREIFDQLLHIFRTTENMSHLEDVLGKGVPAKLSRKWVRMLSPLLLSTCSSRLLREGTRQLT